VRDVAVARSGLSVGAAHFRYGFRDTLQGGAGCNTSTGLLLDIQ
jgi:hypothetical protein